MRQPAQHEVIASVGQPELAFQTFQLHISDHQIGLARRSISDDGTLHVRNDGLDVGFVDAENSRAVKWHAIHKLDEGALNIFERGVLIEMFAIDRSDHREYLREHAEAS